MTYISISVAGLCLRAEVKDDPTGRRILDCLPIEGIVNVWGDEIYFEIPVRLNLEPDARTEVEVGELGYWPMGQAFCIFFGPTPVSTDQKPRAYSPVNVFGRVLGDATQLRLINNGEKIFVSLKASP